jgi:hypothetical protein
MLSQKQLKDVCLAYDSTYKKCRYVSQDENDYTKYYCLKKTAKASDIDVELSDFVKDIKKKGKDPKKENVPLGDNCKGYPLLRYLEQGYDKDKP